MLTYFSLQQSSLSNKKRYDIDANMASADTDSTFAGGPGYFAPPHSLDPMTNDIHYGLIIVGLCGLASFLSTLTLFSFLAYRFLTWRSHYKTFIGYNQYIVLFLNLVFADLLQATSFLVSFYWIAKNAILAPTPACTAQGFLLHFGDVASAFFVLSIAIHTSATAAFGKRVAYGLFATGIGITWLFTFFLTILGVALYGKRYFVRAGAWCWVSSDYEPERLALHYIWLFIAEFGLIIIYLITFFKLRSKTRALFEDQGALGSRQNKSTVEAVNRITKLMMLYPMVYVVLTLPLSSTRMWSMAHGGQTTSDITACTVGALLASCGWVDCLLYTLTRKRLLQETMGGSGRSAHSVTDPDSGMKGMNSILATTTFTVRNESLDGGSPHKGTRRFSEHMDDDNRPAKERSVVTEQPIIDRSPSPTESVEPILPREKGGMRRMLSDARKEVQSYELRPMPKQVNWRASQ